MGNTCTNCSQCKGDNEVSGEVLTVDNKVSDHIALLLNPFLTVVWR